MPSGAFSTSSGGGGHHGGGGGGYHPSHHHDSYSPHHHHHGGGWIGGVPFFHQPDIYVGPSIQVDLGYDPMMSPVLPKAKPISGNFFGKIH